tara:strand:+ start:228 stop:419 length:192 start_codon:yes stop_codon:yes gene_type:complete
MNVFGKDESVKPDESNVFNIQPFIEIIKIQISDHVDNEILRFEKQIDEIIQRILNKPIKGKYE